MKSKTVLRLTIWQCYVGIEYIVTFTTTFLLKMTSCTALFNYREWFLEQTSWMTSQICCMLSTSQRLTMRAIAGGREGTKQCLQKGFCHAQLLFLLHSVTCSLSCLSCPLLGCMARCDGAMLCTWICSFPFLLVVVSLRWLVSLHPLTAHLPACLTVHCCTSSASSNLSWF